MLLKLNELTTEQKLGMLYCARPSTDEDIEAAIKLIKKRALGSIQIPPHRTHHVQQVLEAADYPIIVVCDTETGFPTSQKQPISLMALSACNKKKFYQVFAKAIATEARAAGFNATWGPVIDLINGNGPCKVHRCFSDDVLRTCEAAEAICQVYARNGYMSCGKHYPGGGDLPYDGHMTPTPSSMTLEQLQKRGLVPYQYLLERGLLPSIMSSHTTMSKIDPDNNTSVSPKVLRIIRDMGFDGVCWTDSFAMMSILQKYGEDKILGLAIAAGNDIVLPNYRTSVADSYNQLLQNYADGLFSEERLNESARRVVELQSRLAQIPEAVDVFTEEDQVLYDSIARECITAVTDEGVSPALDPNKSKLFIILTDTSFQYDDGALEISNSAWYNPNRIVAKVKEAYPDAGIAFLSEFAKASDNERVLVASTEYDEVVFISFCDTTAYLGTDCLTRRTESVINALILSGKLGALVHFGNPFAVEPLLHTSRIIFGYNMPDSQLHAIDVLTGKTDAHGTLPFRVNIP